MVFPGVAVMFGESSGEVVPARQVVFCAHIYIIAFSIIEDGIDCLFRCYAYRSRRESVMFISIVGRVYSEVFFKNPFYPEVSDSEFYGRIGLQRDSFSQSVDVKSGDDRHFVGNICFFLYDRGEGCHLYGTEPGLMCFLLPFIVPFAVIFPLHAVEQAFGRYVPIYVISIGQ